MAVGVEVSPETSTSYLSCLGDRWEYCGQEDGWVEDEEEREW